MRSVWKWLVLLAVVPAFLFAGCGGDDDDDIVNPPPPGGTTAIIGDDGQEATEFDSFEQVALSLADLQPNTMYTIEVDDGSKAVIST
jgi:hypothetical protein